MQQDDPDFHYSGLEPQPIDLVEPDSSQDSAEDSEDERWEHYVELIEAETEQKPAFVQQFYSGTTPPPYAVHALIPRLNELGDDGWELVHLQPVSVSYEGEMILQVNSGPLYTHTYLCAFKRRVS